MKVSRFMAQQYARPSGLFGRLVVSRLLNRVNRDANKAVLALLAPNPDSTVLEVGFGGGELLATIADSLRSGQVVGLETSLMMLARMRQGLRHVSSNSQVTLCAGAVEQIPLKTATFDRVCSVNTLYFWRDLHAGMEELCRVAASGGRIVLGFGGGSELVASGYMAHGFRFYSPDVVRESLNQVGLVLEKEEVIERPGRDAFYITACTRR